MFKTAEAVEYWQDRARQFGQENVPAFPGQLRVAREVLLDKGLAVEPVYFVGVTLTPNRLADWRFKPGQNYWDLIWEGHSFLRPNQDAATLRGNWVLIESSIGGDPVPADSRHGLKPKLQDEHLFPKLQERLGLKGISIERPTGMELLYVMNHINTELPKKPEWLQDIFGQIDWVGPFLIARPVVYPYHPIARVMGNGSQGGVVEIDSGMTRLNGVTAEIVPDDITFRLKFVLPEDRYIPPAWSNRK